MTSSSVVLPPMGTPVRIKGVDHYIYKVAPIPQFSERVFLVNEDSHERLKCGPNRRIKNNGGRGTWSQWLVSENEGQYSLQNVGHLEEKGTDVYLGTRNGIFVAVDSKEMLQLEKVDETCMEEETTSIPYDLSQESIQAFIEKGVLQIPGLVSKTLVDNALLSINEALGVAWEGDNKSFFEDSRRNPAILALLYKSPLFGVLERFLGKGNVKRVEGGQIAMRFPNNRNPKEENWHIDGSNTTHMTPFQILVGIALSPTPIDDCGNLVVFEEKHPELHDAVGKMRKARKESSKSDEELTPWMGFRPTYGARDSKQVHMEPGDVVLAHQKIPHRVAHNKSPNIRYMVYFRISHKNHVPEGELGGLWAHFDGIQVLQSCSES